MNSIEQTAKTLDEAVALALEALGVTRDEAEVAIIEVTNKSGLFGFLGQPSATVRVTVKEKKPAAQPPAAEASPARAVPAAESHYQEDAGAGTVEDLPLECSDDLADAFDAVSVPTPAETTSDFSEEACDLVQDILEKMNVEADAVIVGEDDSSVSIELHGPDLGILIGKRGMHLNSFQYLVNVILGKGSREHRKVVLDGGNYRERREQALTHLAHTTAEKAKRRGRGIRLTRLRADERRLIHVALQDDPTVETYSEGFEPNRSIIIAPAGQAE